MRFGKKGKLALRYVGSFPIIGRVELVAYRLGLPEHLQWIHNVFQVSTLKRYRRSERAFGHLPLEEIDFHPDIS